MDHTIACIAAFLSDESGTTAIEYGLLAGLIAVTAIAGISAAGDSVLAIYEAWSAAVVAALSGN
ncbi:MAG: Flp family type IVb pilin [Pseudomonadota bacterium]